ncbi:uncharacterized protein LOC115684647 isoform X3 [Syzygium oleosum]|uniref:uncharacterized protein LOC115684647 isoform X3 n=1 Tax=Syzygium oleosum TaxID=219896 RepID=UPI0011D22175|nr:uncharacterized protein LOC115684647 isoform X3 [Syzygium oleosum]
MATAATVPLTSARLLRLRRKPSPPAAAWSSSLSSLAPFKMGLLQSRSSAAVPPGKLTVRAARAESERASLGFRAPQFQVMFTCNHCPFVKHLKKDIVKLTNFYMKKGLAAVAISSNSVMTHPQDGPEFMAEEAKAFNYPFPYLYDESQDVARDFGAVCTPEFYLFKKGGRRPFELVYHGQFDDSRPSNNVPVTGRDLSLAIDCVLSGQPVSSTQKPSVGCSIKWHPEVKV